MYANLSALESLQKDAHVKLGISNSRIFNTIADKVDILQKEFNDIESDLEAKLRKDGFFVSLKSANTDEAGEIHQSSWQYAEDQIPLNTPGRKKLVRQLHDKITSWTEHAWDNYRQEMENWNEKRRELRKAQERKRAIDTRKKNADYFAEAYNLTARKAAQAVLKKYGYKKETSGWRNESDYYINDEGKKFRVSDHSVPLTSEREYNLSQGGFTWATSGNQIIIDENSTPASVEQDIKEYFDYVESYKN
jgi:hypothetical protein